MFKEMHTYIQHVYQNTHMYYNIHKIMDFEFCCKINKLSIKYILKRNYSRILIKSSVIYIKYI